MSRHHLVRIIKFAAFIGCWTALLDGNASSLPTSRWTGSASCTITTTNTGYTEQQIHTWLIVPLLVATQGGSTFYSEIWTVTGTGSGSGSNWIYNGRGYGTIEFRIDANGSLHIDRSSTQTNDPTGIIVTPSSNKPFTWEAFEWNSFPNQIIDPKSNQTHVQGMGPQTVNGSVGYQEPGGSTHTSNCSWDFNFGVVLLQPLPGPLEKPPTR